MLLCGAEHPLYAKKMGQVPCLFSYLRTRRITYKMDNSVVVSLRDIVVEFDGQRILDGLNLDIHDKEFVTLLGSSGCGKTTTLRLIAGFLEPNAGKVLLKGEDITGVPPYKRPVNTVFQITSDPPVMAISCNHQNFTNEVIKRTGPGGGGHLGPGQPPWTPSAASAFALAGRWTSSTGWNLCEPAAACPSPKSICAVGWSARLEGSFEGSTHTVFFARVVDCVRTGGGTVPP